MISRVALGETRLGGKRMRNVSVCIGHVRVCNISVTRFRYIWQEFGKLAAHNLDKQEIYTLKPVIGCTHAKASLLILKCVSSFAGGRIFCKNYISSPFSKATCRPLALLSSILPTVDGVPELCLIGNGLLWAQESIAISVKDPIEEVNLRFAHMPAKSTMDQCLKLQKADVFVAAMMCWLHFSSICMHSQLFALRETSYLLEKARRSSLCDIVGCDIVGKKSSARESSLGWSA